MNRSRRQFCRQMGLSTVPAVLPMLGLAPALAGSYDDFFLFIKLDRPDGVRKLLVAGFDVNARDEQGRHGVEVGLREASSASVKLLLEWPGVDALAVNRADESLLMMASLKHDLSAMARLLALGAAVNRPGWTPLHYAATGGSLEAIDLLLSRGAQIDAQAPNGNTPLMMAAGYGTIDAAELLVRRGANVRLGNQAGRMPADMARAAGFDGLAKRLQALAGSVETSTAGR